MWNSKWKLIVWKVLAWYFMIGSVVFPKLDEFYLILDHLLISSSFLHPLNYQSIIFALILHFGCLVSWFELYFVSLKAAFCSIVDYSCLQYSMNLFVIRVGFPIEFHVILPRWWIDDLFNNMFFLYTFSFLPYILFLILFVQWVIN